VIRAHFGHRRKISLQVVIYHHYCWCPERTANFWAHSIFSKLLILLMTRITEIEEITTGGHVLGTVRSGNDLAPRHTQLSALSLVSPLKFSTATCGYLNRDHRLHLCRLANIGVSSSLEKRLSFSVTLVTVLVRRTVTLYVSLGQTLSLRKLCVAHFSAQGASNENSSGSILRLRSVLPTCVYACCHAQPCVRSRTVRPARRSTPVSPALWHPQGTGPVVGQASNEITLSQGASAWGRLAH
jgi:hypothetical protein